MSGIAPSVLALPATFTHEQVQPWLAQARAQIQRSPAGMPWQVQADCTLEFDSSALAVLLACQRQAASCGCSLVVHPMSAPLEKLARLYGIHDLLTRHSTHPDPAL